GSGQLILVIDDGWAAAHDWSQRQAAALDLLNEARREDRPIVLVTTAPAAAAEPPAPLAPLRAADASAAVEALKPKPWPVDRKAALARLQPISMTGATAAIWLSDGVDDPGAAALAKHLADGAGLRYLAADEGAEPRLIAAGTSPAELAEKDLVVAVRSLPAPQPRPVTVRASAEDGALLARTQATLDAGGIAQPHDAGRDRGRERRRRRPPDRRALAPPPGRHRRLRQPGGAAAAQRHLLSRTGAPALHRDAPRPRHRPAEARPGGADLCRCRPQLAGRGGGGRQMDLRRRPLAALRRPEARRAERSPSAGPPAPRRPHDRRRAVLGKAGAPRALRRYQPLRRPGDPRRRDRVAPGA